MFKGSRATLMLFVWVFWIGASLIALYEAYAYLASGGPLTVWDIITITLSILYLGGGLALAFRLDALLPQYRREIVRLVTIGFCIGIALNLSGMFSILQNPSSLDPNATSENSSLFVIAMGIVSVAFNFLIYKIVVDSINTVSKAPSAAQSRTQTVLYWTIVIAFFATMLLAILWDPTTNSFNVL